MLRIERYINELMTSNCYILWDDESHRCVVIDPGSEKSLREIAIIESHNLQLDYIIITHEHTDHNWGVNTLKERYPDAETVCHKICADSVKVGSFSYFRFFNDDTNYQYTIPSIDVIFDSVEFKLNWDNRNITLLYTPGHSLGSICVEVDGCLFSGDTLIPFKPYINKRNGDKELFVKSVQYLFDSYPQNTILYPGHGDKTTLMKIKDFYRKYLRSL